MNEGFKKFHHKDRPTILALMRHSLSAFAVWWFMCSRSDRNDIFCVKEEFIIGDTDLSKNVVRAAKRLLREYGWITLTGVRSQVGRWDTNEYKVQIGRAPTAAQKVCSGKKSSHQSPENGLPSGAQKVGRTVDIHTPDAPRGGEGAVASSRSRAGGVGGIPPRGFERSDGFPAQAVDQGDAIALGCAPFAFPSGTAIAEDQNRKSKPNPMGAAPPNPPCGDMGVSEPKVKEQREEPVTLTDAQYLATLLWYYIQGRLSLGQDILVLPRWEQYWSDDFQSLLDKGATRADIEMVIWASQWPANQKYYKRSKSICDQFELLLEKAQKRERLFRHWQCPGCHCYFSLHHQFEEHIPVCEAGPAAVLPAPDDASEEEAWLAAEDLIAAEGAIVCNDDFDNFDPFAGTRYLEVEDEYGNPVYEESEPGKWTKVMMPEDWGQHDFDFEMPEPFKTPAKGSIRPEGETEKPDWIRRAEMWGHGS